ncbi:hypothetical protein HPB52_012809 [Rhipicephalus sanguineus]|uniref:Uncharacterized protein n=1 Tax=Rhipicephalus sanguineus TaxID=34632 RepID=A0A9D4SX79_RHISA|nr:hypothetical protein HPB52_012809 [Rhipicephalus sanguineus]
MFFGSCCQMPSVGFIVFVYGVANFLAFVGETTYSLATIAEMPEADHYPEYFRAVVNGIVRVMTMSMCAWWIVSANQARARGMKIAFAWILLRAVGNVMYAYGSVLYETVLMAFVLSRMHVFYCLMTAPEHWQDHEKEQEPPADKTPAVAPAKTPVLTGACMVRAAESPVLGPQCHDSLATSTAEMPRRTRVYKKVNKDDPVFSEEHVERLNGETGSTGLEFELVDAHRMKVKMDRSKASTYARDLPAASGSEYESGGEGVLLYFSKTSENTTFQVWIEETEERAPDGTTTKVYKACLKAVSGVSGLLKKLLKWVVQKLLAFTK